MDWQQLLDQPFDAVEVELLSIWESVLATRPIGISTDFFDLDGNSLAAARIMAIACDRFELDLPVSALFRARTIHALAGAIKAKCAPERSALIPIQTSGHRVPLVLAAGAGGYGQYFAGLAQHLGDEQPVYSLQAAELRNRDTVAAIASQYIAAVQLALPEGTFRLGGYSHGGVIAFEMAQQLRQQGRAVDLLILFDSVFPRGDAISDSEEVDLLVGHAQLAGVPIDNDMLSKVAPKNRLDVLVHAARAVMPPDTLDRGRQWLQWVQEFTRAVAGYRPSFYDGPVLMCRCAAAVESSPHIAYQESSIARWRAVSRELESITVPATHADMFWEPAVGEVARVIKTYLALRDANTASPRPRGHNPAR